VGETAKQGTMAHRSTKAVWQLQQNIGLLKCAQLQLQVDLRRPSNGLRQIVFQSQPIEGCIPLQVSPHPPAAEDTEALVDFYVRGNDLVAKYVQTPQRTIEPTFYWRALDLPTPFAGIELMVSMQTSLLDSDPTLTTVTECDGDAFWLTNPHGKVQENQIKIDAPTESHWDTPSRERGFFLFRLRGCDVSYAEMVLPADFQGGRVKQTPDCTRLAYELFPESLEKGVIRRGRIRSLFLPRQRDAEVAWDVFEDLRADKPPLTT
jgi:hypothetical protein